MAGDNTLNGHVLDELQKRIDSEPALKKTFKRMHDESGEQACKTLEDAERMFRDLDDGKLTAGRYDRENFGVTLNSADGAGKTEFFSAIHGAAIIEKFGINEGGQMMAKHFDHETMYAFGYVSSMLPSGKDIESLDHPLKGIAPMRPDISKCTIG